MPSGRPVTEAQAWLGVLWLVVVAPLVGGHGLLGDSPDGAQCRYAELGARQCCPLPVLKHGPRSLWSLQVCWCQLQSPSGHGESNFNPDGAALYVWRTHNIEQKRRFLDAYDGTLL